MKSTIKILIADDHPIFRRGLASVIEADSNLEIIGEAQNGQVAIELIKELNPEIVVLDISMPIMNGIEAARIIYKDHPKIKIIFLTMEKDRSVLNALKTFKVKGYLLKDSAVLDIVNCIKFVASGRIFISPEISELLMQTLDEDSSESEKTFLLARLTPTETRVLHYMADSKSNKEIAEEMFISIRTAENHRSNMCAKLNLSGNHSLLKFALENKDLINKRELF